MQLFRPMLHSPLRFSLAIAFFLFLLSHCSESEQNHSEAPVQTEPLAMVSVPVDTPAPPQPVELEEREKVFEEDIRRFEEMERENPTAAGGILFTGSSSIRKWESLEEDMAGLPVVNRGFGGSTIRQVDAYVDRIVTPLEPRLIVLYCGENDIANDKYPAASALTDFEHFVALVRHRLPQTQILYVSMKPSPARWQYWEKFEEGNRMIADHCGGDPLLTFVDVGPVMIGENGEPKADIFVKDRLHMNPAGYALWTSEIRPAVEKLVGAYY